MRKVSAVVLLSLLSVLLGGIFFLVFRVSSNLKTIRQQVSTEGILPFERLRLRGLESAADLGTGDRGFTPLSYPTQYTTGTTFAGKLYLAGPSGLAIFDQPDTLPKLLRTGVGLPTAPIVALTVGRLRGDGSSSLIAATKGEGLIIFEIDSPEAIQIRPREAAARDVTALLPLASGDLLIGTRRAGLLLYNGKTLKSFLPSLAGEPVTALAGGESDFWVGTRTRGVLHWRAGQLDVFDPNSGLPDAQVEDIAIGKEGVFVGTPLGVAQFNDGHFSRVLAKGVFAHALALDRDTLVVGSIDQGLREISLNAHSATRAPLLNEDLQVTHFFTTDEDLFTLSGSNLLRREHGGGWQKVTSSMPHQLADRNVTSLTFAPDGRLWIGYFDRGVDVFDLRTGHADHIEDDHVFCVNRIVADPQRHTMDIATANGLALVDPAKSTPEVRQVLSRRDGLISDQVTDIAFTHSGMMLATPAGLTLFTPTGAQSIYAFHGLANNHVYALAAQPDSGRVLAGTLGGISILEDETVRQNVTLRNSGLKSNWITALVQVRQPDASDTWFLGTYGGGVMQMDTAGHTTAMDSPAPAAVINPNAMLQTHEHVFAGSLADGLLVYNRSSHRWSQITTGLPSLNVTALAEDHGELFVGTDNGIVHIAEARLQ
jgi:ligand-binding sensor domain-containing protein